MPGPAHTLYNSKQMSLLRVGRPADDREELLPLWSLPRLPTPSACNVEHYSHTQVVECAGQQLKLGKY